MTQFKSTSAENTEEILDSMGIKCRFNSLKNINEFKTDDMSHWDTIADNMYNSIISIIEMENTVETPQGIIKRYSLSKEAFLRHIDYIALKYKADPVKEWILSLPEVEMDIEFLENILIQWYDAEDTEYNRETTKLMFKSIVKRIFEPGCNLRHFPVLAGGQAIGKSSFCKYLLPLELNAFNDDIGFHMNDKQLIEAMIGKTIVEIGEMRGASSQANEKIKSFITRATDQTRLAYGRNVIIYPRACYFIGTANNVENNFLPIDASGNSRWLPVELKSMCNNIKELLNENRDKIFSIAYQLYKINPNIWFPDHLQIEQNIMTDKFTLNTRDEVLEELVVDEYKKMIDEEDNHFPKFPMQLMATRIGYGKEKVLQRKEQQYFGKVLRTAGFTKKHDSKGLIRWQRAS